MICELSWTLLQKMIVRVSFQSQMILFPYNFKTAEQTSFPETKFVASRQELDAFSAVIADQFQLISLIFSVGGGHSLGATKF